MATKKKMLQAAAGNAAAYGGGASGPNVESMFSTYVYTGNGGSKTITNDIDLNTDGGMVWMKRRSSAQDHNIYDTERGAYNRIKPNLTNQENSQSNGLTSFNNNGWSMLGSGNTNGNGDTYASWTFKKQEGFFDVITWTGDGSGDRTLSHNLGTTIGAAFVKDTSGTGAQYGGNWQVYHRSLGTSQSSYLNLNTSDSSGVASGIEPVRNPTDTNFLLRGGGAGEMNVSGVNYVAYLFAHNDGDSSFGPTGDQDVIKCGSYTGNDGAQTIDLGFEPQWVMIKNATNTGNWAIFDVMRDFTNSLTSSGPDSLVLYPNLSNAETGVARIFPTANGFGFVAEAGGTVNATGQTYVYIAIRRPMAVPTDATDVFDVGTYTSTGAAGNKQTTGFPVDLSLIAGRAGTGWMHSVSTRLIGGLKYHSTSSNAQEVNNGANAGINFDHMDGFDFDGAPFNNDNSMYYLSWKRAAGFMDHVLYAGTGTAMTVPHNLTVPPEMMWIKARDRATDWYVYHKDLGATNYLKLSGTNASTSWSGAFNDTAPTDTVFSVGTNSNPTNQSPHNYLALLFASLDGVSKVGSYSGDSTTGRVIDCGFSNGARFVLIKQTNGGGDWWAFDTERGITTSVARGLRLNTTDAEVPTGSPTQDYHDRIDPSSSGFIVNHTSALPINQSGSDYIFYAIA